MRIRPEPVEVQVERLPEREAGALDADAAPGAARPLPPIVFGLAIDALDFATRGPRWLLPGFALGGVVGFALARKSGFTGRRALGMALLCGVYCGLPATAPIPLGTLVGAYAAFFGRRARAG